MSLIPYHPKEGREIVLRHRNAVVVRDRESKRLEIRRSECPTCHQPLARSSSADRNYDRNFESSNEYMDPDYFRMLRTGNHDFAYRNGPPSPIRRLVEPASATTSKKRSITPFESTERRLRTTTADTPRPQRSERSRIRREAFSPNYFKTFFVEERVLGKGGKGVVLLVRHEIDGCPLGHFACKRVPVGDDHAWLENVLVEVELLAKLSHPNLVSYRHVWLEDVNLTRFGPSVACAFILQQYCNSGDLHQYVVGGTPKEATKEDLKARMRRRSRGQAETSRETCNHTLQLSFEEIYSLFKDITSGVAYLHGANYIHRDLKPSNCLLNNEGGNLRGLISDFGEVQSENAIRNSTGSTGTISYCAPEVLKIDASGQYGNFTTKSDVFSLGMILYFMCFGRLPYHGANTIQEELEDIDQLRAEITDWQGFEDERQKRPDLPSKLYRLLKKLLAIDPGERPSANEVLLAMKSETNFDNITNGDWMPTSASTLRGHRIQNLDSPLALGTPLQDIWEENGGRHGLRNGTMGPSHTHLAEGRNTSHELSSTSSHNNDYVSHGKQTRSFCSGQDEHDPFESLATEDSTAVGSESSITAAPHLLMAPPRTQGEEFRYQLIILSHRVMSGLQMETETVDSIVRLIVFLAKLLSLARPCWPYVASIEVGFPLMTIAALELSWPSSVINFGRPQNTRNRDLAQQDSRSGLSMALRVISLGLHLVIIWIARRWDMLCVGSPVDEWT